MLAVFARGSPALRAKRRRPESSLPARRDCRRICSRSCRSSGAEVVVLQPLLRDGGNGHQRIVDLVCHAGDQLARGREAALFLGPLPQHRGHVVEVLGQAPDLVGVPHRHLGVEVALRDMRQPFLEVAERCAQPPVGEDEHGRQEEEADAEPPEHGAERLAGGVRELILAAHQVREPAPLRTPPGGGSFRRPGR